MPCSKLKILLIEDSVPVATAIKKMLSEAPCREFSLQHVQGLAHGLGLLQSTIFHAVLVDLELPGSKGLQAALAVRERSAEVPILALTADDDDELALAALQAGLQDYLVKSRISGPQLARAIVFSIRRKLDSDLLRKDNEGLELQLVQLEEQNLELRRAQVEAEMLEEVYHNLYHFAPVGYLTIDKRGRISEGNEVAARLLGCEKAKLPDQSLVSFLDVGSMMSFIEFARDIFVSKSRQCCEVKLLQGFRAQWLLLEGILAPCGAMERQTYHIALIDITERKRAEERIVRLNEALSEQATKLEEANKELEAFNYTVAHDLRQPLNLISISCQAIKTRCGDLHDEECLSYLISANRGVARMNDLIETLLNFSLAGKVGLKGETVDLSELSGLIASGLKATAPERRAIFDITNGLRVQGDSGLLRVGLENLLGNAWKFTESREEALIAFGITDEGGKEVYFVRDNGIGFDMAEAGGIFSPFAKLPSKRHKGFGIGLATVERIIVRHGGRVWAEGEPGKGATFYFTLPGTESRRNPSKSPVGKDGLRKP